MNKETSVTPAGVYAKLSLARQRFHELKLTKTGHNKFADYKYFELGDFLIPALKVFHDVGLIGVVKFDVDLARMEITDLDDTNHCIIITSPMGSAALKGCHEVQNIGAVETYQRRYLWVAALEIVEHDALDATTGKAEPVAKAETGLIDDHQFATLTQLMMAAKVSAERLAKRFNVDSVKQLPASLYDEAATALTTKIKEMA